MADTTSEDLVLTSPRVGFQRGASKAKWLGWLSFAIGMSPVAYMLIGGGLFGIDRPAWWGDAVLGPVWGTALAAGIAAFVFWAKSQKRPGSLSIDGDAVVVQIGKETHRISRDEIIGTTVVPGRALLLQLADGRMLTVEIGDEAEANKLLSELNLGAEKRRFQGKMKPGVWRTGLSIAGFFALMMLAVAAKEHLPRVASGIVFLVGALTMLTGLVLGTRPPRIEVGADGVHVERVFGTTFVSFADLASVRVDEGALLLTRGDGTAEKVHAPRGNETLLTGLQRRIELGLAAHADMADAGERLALLARRDRDIATWRGDLEKVVGQDVGYRALPLSRDDLEAILAAPATSIEHRIGAALALEALDGEDAEPKIRIAADLCARQEARIALEQIAEQELEAAALDAALEAEV